MTDTNAAQSGTQTFLIECNRGTSKIDANAPESNNAKWETEIDFSFQRGDRVGVEAVMIEATGAGSQQQTIEFSGENVKSGNRTQNWTDDTVILEFGFYINNNGKKTINLPLRNSNDLNGSAVGIGLGGGYDIYFRSNSGLWLDPADVVAGGSDSGYTYQYPGIAPINGIPATNTTYNCDGGGYNFKSAVVGSTPTAYDVFQFLDSTETPVPFGLAGTVADVKYIILSKTGDPNPTGNILTDMAELTIPLVGGYNLNGQNTTFSRGLGVCILNAAGETYNFEAQGISNISPDYQVGAYTGRMRITLSEIMINPIQIDTLVNMEIIPIRSHVNQDPTLPPMRWGQSSNTQNYGPPYFDNYKPGARIGIGLYNGSAPSIELPAQGMLDRGLRYKQMRLKGGAGLWENVRVWDSVAPTDIPQKGSSSYTKSVYPGGTDERSVRAGRDLQTFDLRNYKDNKPYILVSPEYAGPQPTPNGCAMSPELEPMTAYVVIRASSSFEDVNNLAERFTQAFHAINPMVIGKGKDMEKYIDNQKYPFNNSNNCLPLTSTGHWTETQLASQSPIGQNTNDVAALWNRVEPLWIGNLVKCIPANMTVAPDWKLQPGNPYFYYPNDLRDMGKVGCDGDWNWCNLIYGNMGLKNFSKCWAGDRLIRTECWDGNTALHPHRDIPRPVVLNTQMRKITAKQPAPASMTPLTEFEFIGVEMDTYEPIFTNILYNDANLDTIQTSMRHDERYQVQLDPFLRDAGITPTNDFEAQQLSPYWEYEMDIGMSSGTVYMKDQKDQTGLMSKVPTNWIIENPATSIAGPNPGDASLATITPAQSYPGNGSEIQLQFAQDKGRAKVWSRFQPEWATGNGLNGSPRTLIENTAGLPLGSASAFCAIRDPGGGLLVDSKKSQDRNIGALPYIYNDEDGNQHVLTYFMVSKFYQPQSSSVFGQEVAGRSSWELAFFGWGEFFGWSPSFGYDNPTIIPMNPDVQANTTKYTNAAGGVYLPPGGWTENQQNYNWIGANNALMEFDNINNRFTLSGLYTQNLLSKLDASIQVPVTSPPTTPPDIPANETQLGESYAGINADYISTQQWYLPQINPPPPANYNRNNQAVEDSVCGVYLNNIYFAPQGWTPPESVNPKNIYAPETGSITTAAEGIDGLPQNANGNDKTYFNKTAYNRDLFLKDLTKATAENWNGNLLEKMGFDYEQLIPPYGSQDNRYSAYTYGRNDVATMYEGTKPLLFNAAIDVSADLDMNIYTYQDVINPPPPNPAPPPPYFITPFSEALVNANGTPLYTQGLLNNNKVNLGNMNSAKLIAQRIPTLFACPFYLINSDICPTQFQSGASKQETIYFGLKNYGGSGFFYVFGSSYMQLVDTDRTLTKVSTEIRNPLTGRLARLGRNSCIIYKVERDISLPAITLDATGQEIPPEGTAISNDDELHGIHKELDKLLDVTIGEKLELKNVVKDDSKNLDVINAIKQLLKKGNDSAKIKVGVSSNLDFGGAVDHKRLQLSRQDAERIAVQEIELHEAEGGKSLTDARRRDLIEDRVSELLTRDSGESKTGGESKAQDVDADDLFKDLAKLVVSRALKALPITTGIKESTQGKEIFIATAIRGSLDRFRPLLEELSEEIRTGEITVNEAIETLQDKNLYLSAQGNPVGKRIRKKALVGQVAGEYVSDHDLTNLITSDWLSGGGQLETIIKEGLKNEDMVVLPEGEDQQPLTYQEIQRQTEESRLAMKQYKAQKYRDRSLGDITDDMKLTGRNLVEQDANYIANDKLDEWKKDQPKGLSDEEVKLKRESFYQAALKEVDAEFRQNPTIFIRQHGNAGQSLDAGQMLQLKAHHERAEEFARKRQPDSGSVSDKVKAIEDREKETELNKMMSELSLSKGGKK